MKFNENKPCFHRQVFWSHILNEIHRTSKIIINPESMSCNLSLLPLDDTVAYCFCDCQKMPAQSSVKIFFI